MNFRVARANRWNRRLPGLVAGTLTVALYAAMVFGAAGDTVADRVLGQFDFSHNAANLIDAHGLNVFTSMAIDTSATPNRLYVADEVNNRILGYKNVTTLMNGGAADLVIGQPDFVSGTCGQKRCERRQPFRAHGVAVDSGGNLYVADTSNNRVLEYNTPFAGCGSFPCVGGPAQMVFGQAGSFTTFGANNMGRSADSLAQPFAVALDSSGNLYVADAGNSRVLEYNTPLTTDTTADMVLGQSNFTSGICGATSASSLCFPIGVALDGSGNLYVADEDTRRVLEYNTPLTTDTTADMVFGQGGDFTSSTPNKGGLSASSLDSPTGVSVDAGGNVYIADNFNNRVLEYNTPLTKDTVADTVFGQGGSFTSNNSNNGGLSANSLAHPMGVALDASSNLYVADASNSRLLEYKTPLSTDTTADVVLGQLDFSHNGGNLIDAGGMFSPQSVAIDASATPNRLYVEDTHNSRVLGYKDVTTFANGGAADLVIGQPDFISGDCDNGGVGAGSSVRSRWSCGGRQRQPLRSRPVQQPSPGIQRPFCRLRFTSLRRRGRQSGLRAGRQLQHDCHQQGRVERG